MDQLRDQGPAIRAKQRGGFRRKFALAILATVVLALGAYGIWSGFHRPTPVQIALANTLSGPFAAAAIDGVNAMRLYLDEVNANGGIDGHPVELVTFDDKASPEVGRANVQAIADSDCLAVFAHILSVVAVAAGPEYAARHIPALTGHGNPWFFRSTTPNGASARWLAHYVNEILRGKDSLYTRAASIDLLTTSDDFGQSFERGYVAGSGDVEPRLWHFATAPEKLDSEMTAAIDQIARQPEPRIVVVGTPINYTLDVIKRMRRRGISSVVVLAAAGTIDYRGAVANEPEEKKTPGFFSENVYAPTPVLFDSTGDLGQRFAAAYSARYGVAPTSNSARADNMARLMVEALRQAHLSFDPKHKEEDREKVRAALAAFNSPATAVPGMEGPLYFNDHQDMPRSQRMGLFHQGVLESAPIQLEKEENPDLVDTSDEVSAGRMVQLDNDFYWLQRVVFAGIDVSNVSSVDVRNGTFNADLYFWMRYGGSDDLPTHIRFTNLINQAAFDARKPTISGDREGLNYRLYRFSGVFKADFDLHNYPFDTQELLIRFVNDERPRAQIAYAVDREGLQLPADSAVTQINPAADRELQLWRARGIRHYVDSFSIASTLGDPNLFGEPQRLEFGGFDTAIVVQRDSVAFMIKTLIPLALLVLVVFVTLWFPHSLNKERATIPVTAILTSAVLLISINSQLPAIGYTVAIEYVFYVFFALCLMAMISGFLNEKLRVRGSAQPHVLSSIDHGVKAAYVATVIATVAFVWWKFGGR